MVPSRRAYLSVYEYLTYLVHLVHQVIESDLNELESTRESKSTKTESGFEPRKQKGFSIQKR